MLIVLFNLQICKSHLEMAVSDTAGKKMRILVSEESYSKEPIYL